MDGYTEVVCCQDVISDTGETMPTTVMLGSGSIPMAYARKNITLVYFLPCLIFYPVFSAPLVPLIPFPWPEATAPISLTSPALERSIIIYADWVWTDVFSTS